MERLEEIRQKAEAGGPIRRIDMKYLLSEVDRLSALHKREIIITGEYAQRVIDLTARAEKAEAEKRWIPVSERLPKKPPDYFKDGHWWMVSGEDFIVVDSDGKVYEAHWTYGCSCQNYFWYVNSLTPLTNITHWRPLPEPPKGE